ncbi:uncharacterized protein EI90DRAFT_3016363 [Cantharellus anzutake]|uniref:uncharacterized protein n=1 Tax=Cantharellus anzutake TaxID=1750568 RepID=UPI001905E7E7|nr:uncharacterized protein EI90DRAFT_3016363 [Cantharellus anzutake]KAF8331349.1 hypothetical protein EI90DRAFT_3016363 [Cantharellus anzutake]
MNISEGRVLKRRDLYDFDFSPLEGRRVPRGDAVTNVLNTKVDGPTVLIGPLGSCQRKNNAGAMKCTHESWDAQYDYSFLPDNAPKSALPTTVPNTSPQFFFTSLLFSLLFFIFSALTLLSEILPNAPGSLSKLNANQMASKAVASLGTLGFIIGLMSTLVWRISLGRDVEEFNARIAEANGNPQLVAGLSNGFTMMWVAFAFQGPMLVCALFKLHVQAIAAKA